MHVSARYIFLFRAHLKELLTSVSEWAVGSCPALVSVETGVESEQDEVRLQTHLFTPVWV